MTEGPEVSTLKAEIEKKCSIVASYDPSISCCGAGNSYGNDITLSARNGSLGCGSPVNHLIMKDGVTLVDLGSGGGVDVFAAANK